MKLRGSAYKKAPQKKRLNFSAILTKGYFNDNLIQIQMALNKDHMLPSDYLIRRTKPKINSALKIKPKKIDEDISLDSYRIHLDIKNIPYQLEKILDIYIILEVYVNISLKETQFVRSKFDISIDLNE